MSFFKELFSKRGAISPQTMFASLLLGGALTMNSVNDRNFKYRQVIHSYLSSPIYQALMNRQQAECYASDERRRRLSQMFTNVYVWGEGQQVDIMQDYSNYSPKNLKPFKGKDKPNVVDVAFGWYHEAYLDHLGRLWVCRKPKLTSVKVEEIDEKDREGLIEVSEKIPGKPKVKQAAFTR
jgi:alpha-tubulin suppressor-like RCC1 family protein